MARIDESKHFQATRKNDREFIRLLERTTVAAGRRSAGTLSLVWAPSRISAVNDLNRRVLAAWAVSDQL